MPGIVDCFRRNGERKIRTVGIDMRSEPSAKYIVDSFYQVPAATDPDYCDIVLDICRKEKVDIYFPTISAEISAISSRRSEFETDGTILSVSDFKAVEIANNKLQTYRLLEKCGISVPAYYAVHSIQDFIDGCAALGYPDKAVCLKIVNGSGSRGIRKRIKQAVQYSVHGRSNIVLRLQSMCCGARDKNVLEDHPRFDYNCIQIRQAVRGWRLRR
jgi:Carbamoylphosphate synthase large subunit (split gene in MJ)